MILPEDMTDDALQKMMVLVEKHGGEVTDRCQDAFCVLFPTREQQEAYLQEIEISEFWRPSSDPTS